MKKCNMKQPKRLSYFCCPYGWSIRHSTMLYLWNCWRKYCPFGNKYRLWVKWVYKIRSIWYLIHPNLLLIRDKFSAEKGSRSITCIGLLKERFPGIMEKQLNRPIKSIYWDSLNSWLMKKQLLIRILSLLKPKWKFIRFREPNYSSTYEKILFQIEKNMRTSRQKSILESILSLIKFFREQDSPCFNLRLLPA